MLALTRHGQYPLRMQSGRFAAAVALVGLAVGCGQSSNNAQLRSTAHSSVPAEFRPACGRPGSAVIVRHVPVTVRHADCDLTGVSLEYGVAAAVVPRSGEGVGADVDVARGSREPSGTLNISVDATTGDVSVSE